MLFLMLGDVQLHSSSFLEVDALGGTLTINETQDVDAGDYTCAAVNAAGTSSAKISLDVGGETKFVNALFSTMNQEQDLNKWVDHYLCCLTTVVNCIPRCHILNP